MLQRFESFVSGVTLCYKYIQRIKAAEMTELGLKGTHVMCLFFLHQYGEGLTAATLCQMCAEDKAAISRTLNALRDRGLIDSKGNAYRAIWMLTDEGIKIAKRIDGLIAEWVEIGGAGLTEEERASFYQTLGRIAANLRDHQKSED